MYFIAVSFRRTYFKYEDLQIDVKKNGETVLRSRDHDTNLASNTVKNSCLVSCTQGDDIYLEGSVYGGSVHGAVAVPYSTFTVFLVYRQTNGHYIYIY